MKFLFFIFLSLWAKFFYAQTTYFNKTYVLPHTNLAGSVIEKDSMFIVTGHQVNGLSRKMVFYKLDKNGNLINYKYFENDTTEFYPQKIHIVSNKLMVYGTFYFDNYNLTNDGIIFLAEFDLDFNLIWLKTYGGNFYDAGIDFKPTSDNGFILTGSTTTSLNVYEQLLLLKTDSLGNELWQKKYGGWYQDIAYNVIELYDGGFAAAGYSKRLIEVNGISDFEADCYIVKTDALGNKLWDKKISSEFGNGASFITQLRDSNLLLVGQSRINLQSYNLYGKLIKMNLEGDYIWENNFLVNSQGNLYHAAIENEDKTFVVSGSTKTSIEGKTKGLIAKFDSLGNNIWHRTYFTDSTRSQYIYNIIPTKDKGYIMCGSAFDSLHYQRAWVVKMDCFGNDSLTYYYKDSICSIEDCNRYLEDADFTINMDTLNLLNNEFLELNYVNTTNDATISWDFGDGTTVENVHHVSHTYQNAGEYEVSLNFQKGMCELSKTKSIKVIKPDLIDGFALFPNPTSGSFTLLNYTGKPQDLNIYNALGQIVYLQKNVEEKISMNLNLANGDALSLSKGIYFVLLGDGMQKLMIK
jgi:PKD repeat protein